MSSVASRPSQKPPSLGRNPRNTSGIVKKPVSKMTATAAAAKKTPPVPQAMNGVSPFEIMAARIANRVAEMAENVTFAERQP
jgi:hypothetical protein